MTDTITFGDLRVHVHPNLPPVAKLRLSPDLTLDPAFRDEYNLWLRETFGTHDVVYLLNLFGTAATDDPQQFDTALTSAKMAAVIKGLSND